MKITIIGSSGGGKSTLSRKISERFDIPRFEIDRAWFKYDGHLSMNGTVEQKELVSQKIRKDIEAFLEANEQWVFDGTYSKIQTVIAEQADIVVLIKRPLISRVLSHIKRVARGDNRHPEVTALSDLGFTKTIIRRWQNQEDKKLDEFAKQCSDKLVILRKFSEIDAFFEKIKAEY